MLSHSSSGQIVYDLITGMTFAEMMSAKYVVGYVVSAIVFATVLLLLQVWNEKKKKIRE